MRKNLPSTTSYLGRSFARLPGYTIQEYISSGSNGRLFRAFNEITNNSLAFKIVPAANLPEQSEARDSYLLEAKNANQLDHPSVIRCLDVFSHADPEGRGQNVIFVFDYVHGMDLKKYIDQNSQDIDVPFIETFLRTMLEVSV